MQLLWPTCLQSTYCKAMQDHCAASGRSVRVINLDPAAEAFKYACSVGQCATSKNASRGSSPSAGGLPLLASLSCQAGVDKGRFSYCAATPSSPRLLQTSATSSPWTM